MGRLVIFGIFVLGSLDVESDLVRTRGPVKVYWVQLEGCGVCNLGLYRLSLDPDFGIALLLHSKPVQYIFPEPRLLLLVELGKQLVWDAPPFLAKDLDALRRLYFSVFMNSLVCTV